MNVEEITGEFEREKQTCCLFEVHFTQKGDRHVSLVICGVKENVQTLFDLHIWNLEETRYAATLCFMT